MSKVSPKPPPDMERGAIIVEDYRYHLWRSWNVGQLGRLCFVMLNPSTADALKNDATIRKCMGFAVALGYGGIDVVNLFAYRATDPAVLKRAAASGQNVIGPENDTFIRLVAAGSRLVIAAWGNDGSLQGRDQAVRQLLQPQRLYCLNEVNKTGQPKHPLYQPYTSPLVRLNPAKSLTTCLAQL